MKGKLRHEWPGSFQVRWDFSVQNMHRSEDGVSSVGYPIQDYRYGEADLTEIDHKLHGVSRRSKSELWSIAPYKVAGVIEHWSKGGLITPPLLAINMGYLVIVGGNNRIAVCRADDQLRLPFLYEANQGADFARMLTSFKELDVAQAAQ
jgi:hypothetical protein